ncbi:response regulator [Planococcus sp. Sa1BUA13]|uniref:histidine kinase n=2 Tax=Planococcus wigleyi TaxID=2762216 RepID=A0ABR8W9S2_9BACL|nr:response regulator [Planococcus wigleyi]
MKESLMKIFMVISLICILGISFFFYSSQYTIAVDSETETIYLSSDVDELLLTDELRILKDLEGDLRIDDLVVPPYSWKFISNEEEVPNGGLAKDVYWLSFTVKSQSEDRDWLLELANPSIDEAILYSPVPTGEYTSEKIEKGISRSTETHPHHHLIFDLNLSEAEASTYFLRVESKGAKYMPLTIWEHGAFEEHSRQITAWIGLFSGVSLIFFWCCIQWFLKYRQKNFLYLLLLSVSFILVSSTWSNFSFAYIWSNLEWWNRQTVSVLIGAASILLLVVTRELFAERLKASRYFTIIKAMIVLALSSIVLSFFFYPIAALLLYVVALLSAGVSFSIAFYAWNEGERYAGQYAVAQSFLAVAVSTAFLTAAAIIPYLNILHYAIYFFSGMGLLYAAKALLEKEHIGFKNLGELERQKNDRQQLEAETLKHANKQKDEPLAYTSAGLKIPLEDRDGIARSLQETTEGTKSFATASQLNEWVTSGENMAHLVNSVEDLSKKKRDSETGQVEAGIRELSVSKLAASILKQQETKQTLNILVIDSKETNRLALLQQLGSGGYRGIGAEDGQTALRILAESAVDLIVMDGNLDDVTSDELCRQIRSDFTLTELPILMLSDEDGLGKKKDAFKAGANDFLVKPCDKEEFMLRVETLANMRRLTQEMANLNHFLERNVQERSMALEVTNKNLLTVNDEIQEIEKSRNEMLSAISHELGTPITLIHSYIQAVKESLIEENNPRYLDMIHKKLLLLERLTEDLVELTKYKSGNMTLRFEQHELQPWTERLVDSLESDVIQSGREFKFRGTENPDGINQAYLAIDLDRIDQVISNILWNAVKHTSSEEGRIELSLELLAQNNNHALLAEEDFDGELVIRISDNGRGIKKEALPHIFDRFYKIDSSTSYKGSGLGLAIAKEIILAHKGQIWADSKEGKGSVLIIVLPLVLH